jgi:hypothetical protein
MLVNGNGGQCHRKDIKRKILKMKEPLKDAMRHDMLSLKKQIRYGFTGFSRK